MSGPAGYLGKEREAAQAYLPDLDDALAAVPLSELERRGGPALKLFREAGGPGLLIPAEHGGGGAGPVAAVRVQRVVAVRSPALAVATMMHHLSVATFGATLAATCPPDDPQWQMLRMVAEQRLLIASASAEGRAGQSVLRPRTTARWEGGVFHLDGAKKPCSLSASMDLLTTSVLIEGGKHDGRIGMAIVPAASDGVSRRPFWSSDVLAGAESDEVVLEDVLVPESFLLVSDHGPGVGMDATAVLGWTWFELLAGASYVGVASALVERLVTGGRADAADLGALHVRLEAAFLAVTGVAAALADPAAEPVARLADVTVARFAAQDAVMDVAARAAELLGGMAFITDPDIAYLLAAARALAFHPPSRAKALATLGAHVEGRPFDTGIF